MAGRAVDVLVPAQLTSRAKVDEDCDAGYETHKESYDGVGIHDVCGSVQVGEKFNLIGAWKIVDRKFQKRKAD
jgi:hypothetical protein